MSTSGASGLLPPSRRSIGRTESRSCIRTPVASSPRWTSPWSRMTGGNGWPFMSPAKSAPGSSAQLHTQKTHRGRSAYETVETAFTRVFERDIWTARSRLAVDTWLGRPVVYYLEAMPGRKFCSVVPWLCAGGESSVLLDCLAAELLFILFYCMDDDLDGKTTRYGVTT